MPFRIEAAPSADWLHFYKITNKTKHPHIVELQETVALHKIENMEIREILIDILSNYQQETTKSFTNNKFIHKITQDYTQKIYQLVAQYGDRYRVIGSCGKGRWAECPWIAIFDTVITDNAQEGYYLVFLFDKNMNKVYLSLNQGVLSIQAQYKRETSIVLSTRADDFRNRLDIRNECFDTRIQLNGSRLSKFYEKGNIIAKCYHKNDIPDNSILKKDFHLLLTHYDALVAVDTIERNNDEKLTIEENKIRKLHAKFDRRGNIALKVKKRKNYTCEACGFTFVSKYGELGKKYIEAHHLVPFHKLAEGKTALDIDKDFAVLCSNCHRMIHLLNNPSDITELKKRITKTAEK